MDRPNVNDKKEQWVEYAEHLGVSTDGTKEELQERVAEAEAAADPDTSVAPSDDPEKAPVLSEDETNEEVPEFDYPVLSKGDRNENVRVLQVLINGTGMQGLRTDGIFGDQTERALYELQEHWNLDADGQSNKRTWQRLLSGVR